MTKQSSILIDLLKIDPKKLADCIEELKVLGVYNEENKKIEYDDTNTELMHQISAICDKYFLPNSL